MERGILQGIGILRWIALGMVIGILGLTHVNLTRPWLAAALALAALIVTVATTIRIRTDPLSLIKPVPIIGEMIVAFALSFSDGWVFGQGHSFSAAQSLGGAWPLAGVLSAGVAFGPWIGALAGVSIGVGRAGAIFVNGFSISHLTAVQLVSLLTTALLYAVAGGVMGRVAILLRRAEKQISAARARDEIARTLHDGVLQTLAIVERSSSDPALSRLAREQERELRDFLFGQTYLSADMDPGIEVDRTPSGTVSIQRSKERLAQWRGGTKAALGLQLRASAGKFETVFDGRVQVLVADDVPNLRSDISDAVAGAVGEALTNAGKHGHAQQVTIYVEPDDGGIFCSVKDNGCGFDASSIDEGVGITHSIRGRIDEVGGRVEISSSPQQGTEVRIWVK